MKSRIHYPIFAAASLLLSGSIFITMVAGAPAPKSTTPGSLGEAPEKNMRLIFTGKEKPKPDPALAKFGMYANSAPRPEKTAPVDTALPLTLNPGDRIAFIGNTLLDRARDFGYFETLLHQGFPKHQLVVRNLSWAGDAIDSQPRPLNLASCHSSR